jgi:hypothetical protein
MWLKWFCECHSEGSAFVVVGVWALTAELRKKIRKRRKEEGKCRNRKRRKDTRVRAETVFLGRLYFHKTVLPVKFKS